MKKKQKFEFLPSRQFISWLAEHRVSIVFTTYQVGKIFLLGIKPDGRLEIFNRTFGRSMGLSVSSETLYLSSLYQLWRFENSLPRGQTFNGYDRVYVPQVAWTTGDIDIHDIGMDKDGCPVFVNTLFSCIATVSDRYSFTPVWRPPFISKLAAEDRCHLNGMAAEAGRPLFVTMASQSDVADGWRDRRLDGGTVYDVNKNEPIIEGLSMPHSPRVYRGKLWLLDSGNGWFGYIDLRSGTFEKVTFCPGYARGLSFHGDYAIIGLSLPREKETFSGLRLDAALLAKRADARCGLLIVDLRSGDVVHWLRITGTITELYDVAILPGFVRPMAIGLQTDEIRRVLSVDVEAEGVRDTVAGLIEADPST